MTSVTADQIAYLATAVLGLNFSESDIKSVAGTISKPGDHVELRIDEEELYELIIETFYRKVS
jgi:hypothetical protein